MIEFIVSGRLLQILANVLMAEILIGLIAVLLTLLTLGIKGLWSLFND